MRAKECGQKMFKAYRYFLEKIECKFKAILIMNKCDDVYYDSILNELYDDIQYIELYSNDKLIDVLYKEIMYDLKSHMSTEINERYYLSINKRIELENLCRETVQRSIKVVDKLYETYKISMKG